jgi:hypothetical protein
MIEKLISDVKAKPLYYITMILAMAGSVFASDSTSFYRAIGYFVWLFSNGYLLIEFYRGKNIPMTICFLFYEGMNIRGFINNI